MGFFVISDWWSSHCEALSVPGMARGWGAQLWTSSCWTNGWGEQNVPVTGHHLTHHSTLQVSPDCICYFKYFNYYFKCLIVFQIFHWPCKFLNIFQISHWSCNYYFIFDWILIVQDVTLTFYCVYLGRVWLLLVYWWQCECYSTN